MSRLGVSNSADVSSQVRMCDPHGIRGNRPNPLESSSFSEILSGVAMSLSDRKSKPPRKTGLEGLGDICLLMLPGRPRLWENRETVCGRTVDVLKEARPSVPFLISLQQPNTGQSEEGYPERREGTSIGVLSLAVFSL